MQWIKMCPVADWKSCTWTYLWWGVSFNSSTVVYKGIASLSCSLIAGSTLVSSLQLTNVSSINFKRNAGSAHITEPFQCLLWDVCKLSFIFIYQQESVPTSDHINFLLSLSAAGDLYRTPVLIGKTSYEAGVQTILRLSWVNTSTTGKEQSVAVDYLFWIHITDDITRRAWSTSKGRRGSKKSSPRILLFKIYLGRLRFQNNDPKS